MSISRITYIAARNITDRRGEAWFAENGWTPFAFQREVWAAFLNGESGLVHSATGTGKTYAVWLGPLLEALNKPAAPGLKALWITPLRALASDTEAALSAACEGLQTGWRVESRTGDVTSTVKARQLRRPPEALVTTPESLSLMLTQVEARQLFASLQCVIVDEWHELLASKRGVQTELALARLRKWDPNLRTWGMSATLGNLDGALRTLLGASPGPNRLVRGEIEKQITVDSILPSSVERFPWAGHLGIKLLSAVIEEIDAAESCLLFSNTRSQSEIWFQEILRARPDLKGKVELHHGSLDREVREAVEAGIKRGLLKAVVCTSSLDLGVDFAPVDRVLQLGSPKGVARLLQRAGRSGHRPGVPSRVTCVPTHALEMIDIAAARVGIEQGRIETRSGLLCPLDVLSQHMVTVALGGGFEPDSLLDEVRTTVAFETLSREEFDWTLDFVSRGGSSLRAYPEYHKVQQANGRYFVEDKKIAYRHRLSVGTIVSDAAIVVRVIGGASLGSVEESFAARLSPGDQFLFGGRMLEFIRVRDMTCWVRRAVRPKGFVPRWSGSRMPLSGRLAEVIRELLDKAAAGVLDQPETQRMMPLLRLQAKWSVIPRADQLLIESLETPEGHHLFFFPIEGRLVHEGLAALFAYRLSRLRPLTFSMAMNDYGFELLSSRPAPLELGIDSGLFSPENLGSDIAASLNSVEMARRQFREIARVAGLVFSGYPSAKKSAKQVQATSGLLYDVFARYEPDNLLLHQAKREVLERQLERTRLAETLRRLENSRVLITKPKNATPFALPILADRLRESLTSEKLADRIERLASAMEKASDE